jgi:hypothetical protein
VSEVTPTRKRTLFHNFKACEIEHSAPVVRELKGAWSSAATPLPIVCPANDAVPPEQRHIFVDDRQAAVSQHSIHFVKDKPRIVRVMQHVAKQYCVEALITDWEVAAVVGQVIDARRGAVSDVETDYGRAEHALQMMSDETVAAADVENVSAWRQHARDFERHVVCATDLAASSHSFEATFDGCGQGCHRWRAVQPRCLRKSLAKPRY